MPKPTHRDDDLARAVGERIRAARDRKSWSQERLAEILEVTPETVSRWETGTIPVSLAVVALLAEALNVGVGTLLGLHTVEGAVESEDELVTRFRLLNDEDRKLVFALLRRIGS